MIRLCAALVVLLAALVGDRAIADEPTPEQTEFFEKEVRPILAAKCVTCHGPKKQKGELRLDSIDAMLAGGESGPAIEPGKPDESVLVEAINYESYEMPPDGQLPAEQIAALTRWIEMGAPWPTHGGKPLRIEPARTTITDADRQWWAFQPVRRPDVPKDEGDRWSRNEIDRFILRRLKAEGLAPAPEADRRTLIRRATYDLTGLPPTPEEIDAFLADESPDAYERLIDRLLASPRYGEHWARYWLDLVRYAESDGYRQDAHRPEAWRYRDYVIRSLNDDKPYDRFVLEQLAGDEIDPGNRDALTATMYLRHWIYEYNLRDVEGQWHGVLNDITDVTADVFLGMGMGCARCHDHKFDPLLQKDYFRLQAFFTPLWPREDMPLATLEDRTNHFEAQRAWEQATETVRRKLRQIELPTLLKHAGDQGFEKFPDEIKEMIRQWPDDRTPYHDQIARFAARQYTIDRSKLAERLPAKAKDEWQQLREQLARYDAEKPQPLPTVKFVASDIGPDAPPTYVPGNEDEPIEPGFLSVLDPKPANVTPLPEALQSTGRRTTLARWIADPNNPLSTRVIANRVWQFHFGRGLIANASDLGRLGEPPTHPELLDWLTREMVDGGWTLKRIHRLILTSATYRQASLVEPSELAMKVDPDATLLWKMSTRRLRAEAVRDAALAVSGELDLKAGGAAVDHKSPRRSIFTKVIRNRRDPLLDAFDAPDYLASIAERNVTTTPTQALLVSNGDWMLARAKSLAARIQKMSADERELVTNAYRLAYGRDAEPEELEAAVAFLHQGVRIGQLTAARAAAPHSPRLAGGAATNDGPRGAVTISSPDDVLRVANNDTLPSEDFTVEAVIVLRSLFPDATVRTIASQWNNDTGQPGWAFGVTSEKSRYTPRNLILQLVGRSRETMPVYEVIASGLHPELDRPYYVAVSVRIGETGKRGIRFYMKDLSRDDAPLHISEVEHRVTGDYRSNRDFLIGGRDDSRRHQWDGLIDDLRLSGRALEKDELLLERSGVGDDTIAFWQFDKDGTEGKDASPNELIARRNQAAVKLTDKALIDFCHALLCSNEFVYVD